MLRHGGHGKDREQNQEDLQELALCFLAPTFSAVRPLLF